MNLKRIVPILTMLGGVTALSIDIYLPSMPTIAAELNADMSLIQISLTVFLAAFALGQLAYGPLSDRFGRSGPLMAGLGLYTAANLACALAPTAEFLVVARFIQGLGACCGAVSSVAVTRDLFSGRKMTRVMAQMATVIALAPIIAPMIGAFLERHFNWRASFLFLAAGGCLLLTAVALFLPETAPGRGEERFSLKPYLAIMANPGFRDFSMVIGFGFAGLFAFISTSSPILMTGFGVSPKTFGLLFGSNAVMYMIGSHLAGRFAHRLQPAAVTLIASFGMLFGGAGIYLLADVGRVFLMMAPMYLVTLCTAFATPAATSGAMEPFGERAGGASALQGFLRFAVAVMVGGLLSLAAPTPAALGVAIFLCGASCLAFALNRTRATVRVPAVVEPT